MTNSTFRKGILIGDFLSYSNTKCQKSHYKFKKTELNEDFTKQLFKIFDNDPVYIEVLNVKKNNKITKDEFLKPLSEFYYLKKDLYEHILLVDSDDFFDVYELHFNEEIKNFFLFEHSLKKSYSNMYSFKEFQFNLMQPHYRLIKKIVSPRKIEFEFFLPQQQISTNKISIFESFMENYINVLLGDRKMVSTCKIQHKSFPNDKGFGSWEKMFIYRGEVFLNDDFELTIDTISINDLERKVEKSIPWRNDVYSSFSFEESVNESFRNIHVLFENTSLNRVDRSVVFQVDENNLIHSVVSDNYAHLEDNVLGKKFI